MSDYPDPTPEMLDGDPLFDAIWNAIKLGRNGNDGRTALRNDARHIYDGEIEALESVDAKLFSATWLLRMRVPSSIDGRSTMNRCGTMPAIFCL